MDVNRCTLQYHIAIYCIYHSIWRNLQFEYSRCHQPTVQAWSSQVIQRSTAWVLGCAASVCQRSMGILSNVGRCGDISWT
jgi:hypothetical protein